jgi:hypothetical protein
MPILVKCISSATFEKILRVLFWIFRPFWKVPLLHVWVAVDDPYSFIVIQIVKILATKVTLRVVIHILPSLHESIISEEHRRWILKDAKAFARLYSDFLKLPMNGLITDETRIRSATYRMIRAVQFKI